jgi:ATP-dependent protease ClpP protease subunit
MRNLKTARPRARLVQGRTDWYRITNSAGDGGAPADVMIYDEIGFFGVTAADFVAELKQITAPEISLRINSPGGEVFDGIAIFTCLRSHTAKVTTYVDSLAASIASVIALAGDRVVMQPHSQMMIHEGAGLCVGDAADMREMADLLDRQSDNIAGIYAEKAGGTVKQWRAVMRAETWYTAAEAVAAGLADEAAKPGKKMPPDEPMPMDNSWDLSVFRYQGRDQAPDPAGDIGDVASLEVDDQTGEDDDPAPEPAPDLVLNGWDPALFRDAITAAANDFAGWDPDAFRDAVRVRASDAPAVARPAPTRPAYEPPPPDLPPQDPPAPPPVEGFEAYDAEVFRAAVRLRADNAPAAPDEPQGQHQTHDPYDPTVVTRALREAAR